MVRVRRARFPNYDCMVISAKWISEKHRRVFRVEMNVYAIGEKPRAYSFGRKDASRNTGFNGALISRGASLCICTYAALNLALAEVREA